MATNPDIHARAKRRRRPWERPFLVDLARYGVVTSACEAAKIDRPSAYAHRDRHPDFAAEWAAAIEERNDRLERLAIERIERGWDEPVYQGGELVGTITRFSEQLHVRMLEHVGRLRRNMGLSNPDGSPLDLKPGILVIRRVVQSAPPAESNRIAQVVQPQTSGHTNGNGNGHAGH